MDAVATDVAGRRLKIVFTGTGRCATGFYARYMTSAGVPVGHEALFGLGGLEGALEILAEGHWATLAGDSSWMAAPFLDSELLRDALVVHLVRHPKHQIASALKIRSGTGAYHRFSLKHCPGMETHLDHLPTAIAYRYVHWNRMIERQIDGRESVFFKVECKPFDLLEILAERGVLDLAEAQLDNLFADRKYNAKIGVPPPRVYLDDIRSPEIHDTLLEMAARYGYEWVAGEGQ